MTERVRTTISLDPETYEAFKQMAEAEGVSVSRCMGNWLGSTVDGARFVTERIKGIKRSPLEVMETFRGDMAAAAVYAEEQIELLKKQGYQPVAGAVARLPADIRGLDAPSSNTGLKSPARGRTKGGKPCN